MQDTYTVYIHRVHVIHKQTKGGGVESHLPLLEFLASDKLLFLRINRVPMGRSASAARRDMREISSSSGD